jgi:hypothetical protein
VRGGDYFMEQPHAQGALNFSEFIKSSKNKKLLILEFGAGFNTPSVIRWRMSRIVYQHTNANLVRINYNYPEVEEEIESNALGIQDSGKNAIMTLKALFE